MNQQQINSKPDDSKALAEEIQNRLLIVVATYNEAGNIKPLLESIFSYLPGSQVLVIDDQSPDGTGSIVQNMSLSDSRIHCLHRSGKLGLGSATIDGFRWGLERNFDWILTMDADFSHHPESLINIYSKAIGHQLPGRENEASWDIVIGSRYIAGGKIEGWPLGRRVASRLINLMTRLTIGLPTRDNSGAYRCYGRPVLQGINFDEITNKGYGYLQQILYLANRSGFQLTEVPITFRDRTEGESKINFREAVGAVVSLMKLACRRWLVDTSEN